MMVVAERQAIDREVVISQGSLLDAISMPRYFAQISHRGPVRYGSMPGSIGALDAPDHFLPIDKAHCVTHGENGIAVWKLQNGREEIPRRLVIVDREFSLTN
jgi:hypothetical protein